MSGAYTMPEKIVFNWSGGKDSALALYELLQRKNDYEIAALLTVLSEDYDRISMHGVRRQLLERQAAALSIKLEKMYLPTSASNHVYEELLRDKLCRYKQQGVNVVAFGDIFLEELRNYRREKLAQVSMQAIFPLWKRDTKELAHTFIQEGFKTIVTCVDTEVMDRSFVSRIFDEKFLCDLPAAVDPCGENGEFHTFTYEGPMFAAPIAFERGDTILRDNRFYYCDLIAE